MTEYTGFISSLIERSDKVLNIKRPDSNLLREPTVTKLLLILNSGFSMILERLESVTPDKDIKLKLHLDDYKIAIKQQNLSKHLIINKEAFFKRMYKDHSWKKYKYKLNDDEIRTDKIEHDIKELIEMISLEQIEPEKRENIPYSSLFRSLRNSFAHGGIHPLSPEQIGDEELKKKIKLKNPKIPTVNQICRVYFVSKWLKRNVLTGYNIFEFSVDTLYNFWSDWRELLMLGNIIKLSDFDNQIIEPEDHKLRNVEQR